ncbi:MAG TPA: extracellular solute-binding protein [Chloroflexota bacterium]|nr:extracellular solute-binding protein [Chloroflexota bacterium]
MNRLARRTVLLASAGVALAACTRVAPTSTPAPSPGPTENPTPQTAPTVPPAELTPPPTATIGPGTVVAEAQFATTPVSSVVAYTGLPPSLAAGIAVELERSNLGRVLRIQQFATPAEAAARVLAERAAPKADLLLGGSSGLHVGLAKQGLLDPFRSPAIDAIPADLRDPGAAWTGWYASLLAVLINRDRYRADLPGVDAPEDWDDLLKPELKGRVALPDPATTDAGYLFLSGQYFRLGRDEGKALDYMKELHGQVAQYAATEAALAQAIAKGQVPIAVGWADDALSAVDRGDPVALSPPAQLLFDVGAVGLVKGGPNASAARAVMEWLLGKDAAQIVVSVGNRSSTLRGMAPPAGLPSLDAAPAAPYDRTWAVDNRARLIQAWRTAVGR